VSAQSIRYAQREHDNVGCAKHLDEAMEPANMPDFRFENSATRARSDRTPSPDRCSALLRQRHVPTSCGRLNPLSNPCWVFAIRSGAANVLLPPIGPRAAPRKPICKTFACRGRNHRLPHIGVALCGCFLIALFPPNLNRTIPVTFVVSGDVPCAPVSALLSLSWRLPAP
jgi:hypothetical protein